MRIEGYRTILRVGLFSLILLSPLPFGSVQPWAVLSLEIFAAVAALFALGILYHDPEALSPRGRRVLLAACGIVVIAALQLVPLPGGVWRELGLRVADARLQVEAVVPGSQPSAFPSSLEPARTTDALMRFLAYLSIGLATAVSMTRRRHLKQAAAVLALSGGFQAFYGASEYLTGHQHIFGYPKKYFVDEASGTFINCNHFAIYVAMTLPFALSLVVGRTRNSTSPRSWRERILGLIRPRGAQLIGGAVAAAVCWSGVVLSYSRSGLIAAATATVVLIVLASPSRRRALSIVGVLILPTMLMLLLQVRAPGERLAIGLNSGGRVTVWRATSGLVRDHLITGSGLGSFEGVFALYQPPSIARLWTHAHNDWIQWLAEGGVLMALFLLLMVYQILRRAPDAPPTLDRLAALAALFALAIHSCVDFGLRIPAVAVLLAFIVGIAVVQLPASSRRKGGFGRPTLIRGSRPGL